MIEILAREHFGQVFTIMEASFPKDEYRTYHEQKALMDNPKYEIYVVKDSQTDAGSTFTMGSIKAFIAVWEFDTIVFIEHFAVNPMYRNSGIGSSMLEEVCGLYDKIICLEVEPPEDEITRRRVGFYQRNHFFFNSYHYMQPSISKGRKEIPLFIMTYGRPVSKSEFEVIKILLYKEVYKQISFK